MTGVRHFRHLVVGNAWGIGVRVTVPQARSATPWRGYRRSDGIALAEAPREVGVSAQDRVGAVNTSVMHVHPASMMGQLADTDAPRGGAAGNPAPKRVPMCWSTTGKCVPNADGAVNSAGRGQLSSARLAVVAGTEERPTHRDNDHREQQPLDVPNPPTPLRARREAPDPLRWFDGLDGRGIRGEMNGPLGPQSVRVRERTRTVSLCHSEADNVIPNGGG